MQPNRQHEEVEDEDEADGGCVGRATRSRTGPRRARAWKEFVEPSHADPSERQRLERRATCRARSPRSPTGRPGRCARVSPIAERQLRVDAAPVRAHPDGPGERGHERRTTTTGDERTPRRAAHEQEADHASHDRRCQSSGVRARGRPPFRRSTATSLIEAITATASRTANSGSANSTVCVAQNWDRDGRRTTRARAGTQRRCRSGSPRISMRVACHAISPAAPAPSSAFQHLGHGRRAMNRQHSKDGREHDRVERRVMHRARQARQIGVHIPEAGSRSAGREPARTDRRRRRHRPAPDSARGAPTASVAAAAASPAFTSPASANRGPPGTNRLYRRM